MKTFLDFLNERQLTPAGRVKKSIAIRKHRYKLKNRAAIAKRIGSSTRRLDRRTKMAAIRDVYKKIIKKTSGKLSSTQKAEVERLLDKKGKTYISPEMRKHRPALRIVDTKRKKS